MNLKTLSMMGALLLLAGTGANAQKKKEVLNDSNTPLHFCNLHTKCLTVCSLQRR